MRALFADLPEAWTTPSSSPGAAPICRGRASRSCRRSGPKAGAARPRSCAARPRRGWSAGWQALTEAERKPYRERLEFELGVIIQMGFAGYFLIVADFISWAKAQGIPVGPGRGSGAGSVVAWSLTITDLDPLALRPAVRALPQSRARLDAGLRHRFLPGAARRGDPLRPAEIRPRPGRADHHLRQAAGARGAARRRPRAGDALWPGRPPLQAGAEQPGQSRHAWPRRSRASRSCARPSPRIRRGPALRHRPQARGPLPPRLDPCRRRGDRRPAAGRAGAALSRSALRHAGHPVQHEVCRAGGAGEVRLPRPQDPDRADPGGEAGAPARRRARSDAHCRSTTPRPTRC